MLIGTIERGHVYFFYRPKVMIEEAHSLDDVRNFHIVLVPTLPEFAAGAQSTKKLGEEEKGGEENKMEEEESVLQVLPPGADVVPSSELQPTEKKRYRHLIVGKKQLPTESLKHTRSTSAIGNRRGGVFWATVLRVGDDLYALEERMGEKTYETKTRGTRHEGAARLAARGLYAFVNTSPRVPSQRETHFVYRITHPPVQEFGEVQEALGIREAAAFVMQVKNPLAPATGPMQVRSAGGKKAEYPERLMKAVFGTGTGGKGRESYGLRFASCETPELLDCEGAELLFIAGREGQEGLEVSIGEERGEAMKEAEEKEGKNINVEDVLRELSIKISEGGIEVKPLKGEWI
ncbi:hypothetical protein AMATHDRAFT_159869 [Amanita thiersii Skay4041]|uniref:Uncharacterized protein n=1 Tax=Amanita thiersii Skay4041 TaxID=703135 RepID=A0A2A9NB04_9AGAR|nr:hypothetical protein AMATHDRAFT_159869 [Amanita thiersii Skay4041]